MNVADLQQHLEDLARLLRSSGAKSVADDLASTCAGLAPFPGATLKEFAAFLIRSEAFSRGEVPIKGKPAKSAAAPSKTVPPDVELLARDVREIYDRAADPSVTIDQINAM